MRRVAVALMGLLLSSALGAQSLAPPVIVLRAARMFDGRSDATIANAAIVVEGSKIKEVGSNLAVPAGATVVDLGDATLLAGFIDSHMHLTEEAGDDYVYAFFEGLRRTVAEDALRAGSFAKRLLEAGFTTVRNVGAFDDVDVGLRNAIAKGFARGRGCSCRGIRFVRELSGLASTGPRPDRLSCPGGSPCRIRGGGPA
jgi:imidazolonepropionase-like amidohydrolase